MIFDLLGLAVHGSRGIDDLSELDDELVGLGLEGGVLVLEAFVPLAASSQHRRLIACQVHRLKEVGSRVHVEAIYTLCQPEPHHFLQTIMQSSAKH
jgi:hypothetical protein